MIKIEKLKGSSLFKDSGILFIKSIFTAVISLMTVRYTVLALGIDDYGIFTLVSSVVMFVTFFSQTLSMSVQRFFSVFIGTGNLYELRVFFLQSIAVFLILSLVLAAINETVVIKVFFSIINVQRDKTQIAEHVFHVLTINLILSIFAVPFIGMVLARRDFVFYSILSVCDTIGKFGVSLLLVKLNHNLLFWYPILLLAVCVLYTVVLFFYCYRNYLDSNFELLAGNKGLQELFNFSFWTFFGAFAGFLSNHGNNIVSNYFFGSKVNGYLGIAGQINTALNLFSNSIFTAARSRLIEMYAANEFKKVAIYLVFISKSVLLLLLAFSLPLYFFMEFILQIWMGESFQEVIPFGRLILCLNIIFALQSPITSVIHASGRIRNYHLVVETVIMCTVPLTIYFFKFGASVYFSLISSIIVFTIAHVFRLYFLLQTLSFSVVSELIRAYILVFTLCILLNYLFKYIITFYSIDLFNLNVVIMSTILLWILVFYYFWVVIFDTKEKHIINTLRQRFL